jgi:hypothetical protein
VWIFHLNAKITLHKKKIFIFIVGFSKENFINDPLFHFRFVSLSKLYFNFSIYLFILSLFFCSVMKPYFYFYLSSCTLLLFIVIFYFSVSNIHFYAFLLWSLLSSPLYYTYNLSLLTQLKYLVLLSNLFSKPQFSVITLSPRKISLMQYVCRVGIEAEMTCCCFLLKLINYNF